ncbi:gephyrin-like molybdotransferase receptor GlpR [Mycobacterium sp.]|uniref:divisome protein SepX/GlpR n=1 Tax=Mycobacterium sp. TaxID=1785 RepID=UPI003C74D67E
MPSIPQSLLWISLVVLWLFVLVPMLISKRDAVRRTSDVALATRVLNSGAAAARLLKRAGPAAGHRSDPDWQPEEDEHGDLEDLDSDDTEEMPQAGGDVVAAAVAVDEAGRDAEVADADDAVVAEPVAEEQPQQVAEDETSDGEDTEDEGTDQYEYIDDTSGIPVAEEAPVAVAHAFSRRHQHETAAAVSARKYAFRKRVLMVMALALVGSASAAFLLNRGAWWICGSFAAVTVLYLGYLRRQTRIEERVQRRRMHRMARSRLGVENAYDREFDVVPSRLRRPGAVVLEIDDEDPIFEHLDYAPYARDYGWHGDLPRAAGQ